MTPGADHAAARASSCSAHDGTVPDKITIPEADVRFFDTGHFALETHVEEIATAIRGFLERTQS